ncbi:TetR/AcrR family transcriptional regulator [Mycolicibacterium mengxianglii]|uniref:TetR/AcrR family transcriptional regulator n=1 Tax=Mycolicibacterium mengxianglii TaxID=2736649 RepID=UPI0018D0FDE1|nr:TetR/AcrR family transcriptional regulator [Mycolicibacterium mengxianglii]
MQRSTAAPDTVDPTPPSRPLRRDAAENQERVLAAATAVFGREGREVSMAAIAAEAGVGVGTLYRRYPTRESLLEALTQRSFEMVLAAAERASTSAATAIAALEGFYDDTIAHRSELVLPLHGGPQELAGVSRRLQQKIHDTLAELLTRGRREHTVRDDATAEDIIAFGALLAHTLAPDEWWVRSLHRQKQIYLAGLAPRPTALAGSHVQ